MTLRGLGRRLDRLEAALHVEDPRQLELIALEAAQLTDAELELMLEAATLVDCGHSEKEIENIMADRWPKFKEAEAKVSIALDQMKAIKIL